MPQPVHRVLPNPDMQWWDDVLPHRPQLAIHIARIVVVWAEIEVSMAEALSAMLGSQDAAFAMFQTLTSAIQKKRALDAAAAGSPS
jgi:hypothetical protein